MKTTDSFLRLPEVLAIVPVSRGTWYAGIKTGRFPAQVKIGPQIAVWRRSDIERLVASLAADTGNDSN